MRRLALFLSMAAATPALAQQDAAPPAYDLSAKPAPAAESDKTTHAVEPSAAKTGAHPAPQIMQPVDTNPAAPVVTVGEHGAFTRVVVSRGGVKAAQSGRVLTLTVDGAPDISAVAKRNSPRFSAARVSTFDGKQAVEIKLNCDCTLKTSTLPDGRLIADLYDSAGAGPEHAAKTADAADKGAGDAPKDGLNPSAANANIVSARPSKDSVDDARRRVIALLQQAAEDGIVSVKPGARELTPPASAAATPANPAAQGAKSAATPASAFACLPEGAFTIDGRDFEKDPLTALSDLQKELADAQINGKRETSERLAVGYLSIGFGEEALNALRSIGDDRSLYADLARVVAGKAPDPNGLLMGASNCRGAQALWQAAAQSPGDAVQTAARAGDAIKSLPTALRGALAARLAQALLKAGDAKGARKYHDVALQATGPSPELTFVNGRLLALEGKKAESQDLLDGIAGAPTQGGKEALKAVSATAANQGVNVQALGDDLGAIAKAARGTDEEGEAALREAKYWSDHGSIEAGLFLFRDAARRTPEVTKEALETSRELIRVALASGDHKKQIEALSAYVKERDFLQSEGGDVALADAASDAAMALGLPNLGLSILNAAPAGAAAPATVARAALAAGAADAALTAAAPYADQPQFADVLVKANTELGRPYAALASASALPESAQKQRLIADAAWGARDYKSAVAAFAKIDPAALTETDAKRYAYAAYLAGESALPQAAEAVLVREKSKALAQVKALFARTAEGPIVDRGKSLVSSTDADLAFIKEALGG